ncbi:MAG TPA: formyltransferase family protein, partial [Sphingorhabdus lacus]|nr:formyltransferase family protein [Sphingorhabdus lacus]
MTRAKVAVLISGSGTNMAALLYAAKQPECPYEIVLVASNNPDAEGLTLAHGEGIATFAQSHKGIERAAFDAIM